MNGKLKIKEIAAQTGLSISTVSRVLSGKFNTSEKAKQRVMACAREYGVLDDIASGRLLINGIMVFAPSRAFDSRSDIFYYKVIQGLVNALTPHEVRLRYCGLEENNSDAALFLEKMNDPLTEAALLIGIDDPYIHALAADLGKPCILINSYDRKMRLPSVSPDHRLIGEVAMHYLIEQGHHNILNLVCLRRYTMEWRLQGIREALNAHNLPFDESRNLLLANGFSAVESERALTEFLAQCPSDQRPTAILAGGDFMALGAMNALQHAGIRVPQDISIMSIDGFNLLTLHDIPLTSLHVPRDELGEEAIRLLQQRLASPLRPASNILLHGTMALNASVKRLRASRTPAHGDEEKLYD